VLLEKYSSKIFSFFHQDLIGTTDNVVSVNVGFNSLLLLTNLISHYVINVHKSSDGVDRNFFLDHVNRYYLRMYFRNTFILTIMATFILGLFFQLGSIGLHQPTHMLSSFIYELIRGVLIVEFLCRGYVQRSLAYVSSNSAILVATLVNGLMYIHQSPNIIFFNVGLGFLFSVIYSRCYSLSISILNHAFSVLIVMFMFEVK
jgi:membrane protease YdiL (CAAX protease family)